MTKLKSLAVLRRIIAAEKSKGRVVVLANGCFDLFHAGHIRYLRAAKAKGDVLVVALNSDRSVRKLKGRGRPILEQGERAEILSSFSFVDFVTVFDEPTVAGILLALRPDIHVKGSDYTRESVPERDTVKAYGGRTAIVGGPKIRNTSDVIKDITARIGHGA
ncbi:MAG: adenylyltransferase/cytidyltransferase family protein [Candidatus Aminicenantales bacterium]